MGKVNYSKIEQIISENEKIFISTHINPDGDSLGSAFAMYHYLKKIGKDCRIINHSEVPLVYSFLNEKEIFNEINDENIAFIKNADLGIILDIGDFYRTDTGSFRFSNTNQLSHEIAVDAIKMGINISEIYQNIYENSSVSRIKLLGNVIQKLNFDCNGELLWFSLNNDMVKEVDGTNQDFDGFTDFFRGIQGVEIALMLYDLKGKVRLSFRSKGKYKVNNVAKKMGGGGHPFAAAALVDGEFSDVKSTVLGLLSTYINNYDEDTSS